MLYEMASGDNHRDQIVQEAASLILRAFQNVVARPDGFVNQRTEARVQLPYPSLPDQSQVSTGRSSCRETRDNRSIDDNNRLNISISTLMHADVACIRPVGYSYIIIRTNYNIL